MRVLMIKKVLKEEGIKDVYITDNKCNMTPGLLIIYYGNPPKNHCQTNNFYLEATGY